MAWGWAVKTLVIDSHKGTNKPSPNLHWQNARTLATALGGDLIWSYPGVNDTIKGGYDRIVFVHASHYAYTDYAWLEASPDAKLFYVTNEYNLGEPRTLWMAAKAGRHYTVLANHPSVASKVVMKYVDDWKLHNLNALCYAPKGQPTAEATGCAYWGSFRKGRIPYFQKYLASGTIAISTHQKNREKFGAIGVNGPFLPRFDIAAGALTAFKTALYIEDEVTHIHYNYLANRFYEALSWGVLPVFDESCVGTLDKSGYTGATVVTRPEDIGDGIVPYGWATQAQHERDTVLANLVEEVQR